MIIFIPVNAYGIKNGITESIDQGSLIRFSERSIYGNIYGSLGRISLG